MNETPLVSVVMPVYNAAPYLRQCLDSLVNQTYRNLEILCVDDGSTDESPEILMEYARRDPRVKPLANDTGEKGAGPARNAGLNRAVGKYLLILDSDDFFEPDLAWSCVEKAERTHADVVIFRADVYDQHRGRITRTWLDGQTSHLPETQVFSRRTFPKFLYQIGDLYAWNKLYRRDLVERYGMRFESLPVMEDEQVPALALALAERITFLDRILLHYRMNAGASVSTKWIRHPDCVYRAAGASIEKLRAYGVYEDVKSSYLNLIFRNLRNCLDEMDDYAAMKRQYETYLREVFPALGAADLPEGYLSDPRIDAWYRMITSVSLEEILFQAARARGAKGITSVLRFRVPYEDLPKGGKIVLLGKGEAGRQWYSQLILSQYCDVALWANDASEIPEGLEYDAVVTAK